MSRSFVLAAISRTVAAASVIQFGFINPCLSADIADSGQTKVSLHWFDGQSQLVEVDWKASSHWVWKFTDSGVEPTSEIEIAIPAQIHINSVEHADNADFKIVETEAADVSPNPSPTASDDTSADSSNESETAQSLAIETRDPKIAAKLNIDSHTETSVDRGLLVTLEPLSTAILIHGSCANTGLVVHEKQKISTRANPLYVGATCQTEKNDLVIRWHLPEDFTVLSANRQPLQDGVLRVPSPDSKTPTPSQNILILHKGDPQPTEYELTFEPKIVAEKPILPEHQKKEEAKPRPAPVATGPQFAVAAAPAYVGYPSQGNSTNNSSANNINLSLHVEQTQTTRRSLWEAELEVPAFSIFPGPLHFPASGVYSLSGLIVVPPFIQSSSQSSDAKFAVLAGASLHEVHLELNSQASGFFMGPKLALSLADKTRKSLGGRAYSATIAAVALWSSDRPSFFNSYAVTGSFSFELSHHSFFGKRLDLLTEASYFNLLSHDGSQVGVTNTSMGLQLWL